MENTVPIRKSNLDNPNTNIHNILLYCDMIFSFNEFEFDYSFRLILIWQ